MTNFLPQEDQTENNNNNSGEPLTPPPTPVTEVEEKPSNKRQRAEYKGKYDSVVQTIFRWADLTSAEEVFARVKDFKRRRGSEVVVQTQVKNLD